MFESIAHGVVVAPLKRQGGRRPAVQPLYTWHGSPPLVACCFGALANGRDMGAYTMQLRRAVVLLLISSLLTHMIGREGGGVAEELHGELSQAPLQPDSTPGKKELPLRWINITKEQADLLVALTSLVLRISTGIGGFVLLAYAVKEGFFYDVSSLAAISALLFVAVSFTLPIAAGVAYGVLATMWIVRLLALGIICFTKLGEQIRVRASLAYWGFHVFSFLMFCLT